MYKSLLIFLLYLKNLYCNKKQWVAERMTYVRRYVPSGIVTEEVLDNIEKTKVPLVKIYHYHTNHLGTPQELTNQDGDVIWLSYDRAWGGSFSQLNNVYNLDGLDISADELQPFRFQGQFFDGETGLHYNRFRYYDSDVGMFISRDPIGLLGGNNVFQYAPNPVMWIDPWGLVHEKTKGYHVYGLFDVDSKGNPIGDPYYIGITNDTKRRGTEHIESGRLSGDGKISDRKTKLIPLHQDVTYGQARGYEQAYIKHYGTRTGNIGEDISQENRGNKYNSFDTNSKTRRKSRQNYFMKYFNKMTERLDKLKGGKPCA